jgi:transporter family-2 protein
MLLKICSILAALFAGSLISFQAPINARLGTFMGGPLVAAFCSFAVGTLALGFILIATNHPPKLADLQQTEPWMWVGGLMGATFVTVAAWTVPTLGAALMISLFVAGQLVGALIIDKTGFLLPAQIEIGWERIAALVLILAGVVLFMRSR